MEASSIPRDVASAASPGEMKIQRVSRPLVFVRFGQGSQRTTDVAVHLSDQVYTTRRGYNGGNHKRRLPL